MSQPTSDFEDDFEKDDGDDREGRDEDPDPSDQDDSDDTDTRSCPFCRKPVYERADVCPHCGNFITFDETAFPRKLWFFLAVVLALAVVIMAYVMYVVFIVRSARP